jgi:serine/threonine protein kinase
MIQVKGGSDGMRERLESARWQALAPHLDQALDLEVGERARWLAALRAENSALAADLESLLEEHRALEQERFLEVAPPAPPGPASIGPYRIIRELGRGGMGLVYLAEQEGEDFRRLVALKVVEPGIAGAALERRFRDESRILAGLEHAGIARFYDAGRTADGRCFLALEYVEGQDLVEHARQRDLKAAERIALFLEVLDAVEFAHARMVVHRDLKPGNILVGPDGRPRLLDFGIAKLVDPDPDAGNTETRTEYRALTPAYASPEQFRGDTVTAASDVYSLGVVLYEMLSGVRPFAAAGSSRVALEKAVLTEDPPPPSLASRRAITMSGTAKTAPAFALHSRRGRLSRDLDAVCLKALRKEPHQRYGSAAAFAQDLIRYLQGEAVAARDGSHRYRLARLARRHRDRLATYLLALAAAAVVVAAGTYWPAWPARPPEPPRPRAFPLSGATATPITELERRFTAAPASVEAGAALVLGLASKGRVQEAQLVVSRLRQIPGRELDPLTDYAEARVAQILNEPQRALVLFTRSRDAALSGGRGELIGQVRAMRGRLLFLMGQTDEARVEMELARADLERAGDGERLISLLNDLGMLYLRQGRTDEAGTLFEQALVQVRAQPVNAAGRPGDVMRVNLATVAIRRGRPDLAERSLRDVVEQRRRSAHARLHETLLELAAALHELGRGREADPLLDESVDLMRRGGAQSGLGEALFARGLVDLGRARLDRIAQTVGEMEAAATTAGDKATLGLAHHLRGRAAAARGDFPAARRHLAEGSRLLADNGNLDRASDADCAAAAVEHAAGDPAAALRLLDRAQARLANGGSAHPVGFFSATLRARIDAEAGRAAEAHRRLASLGEGTADSPSISRRLAFLGSRAGLARAERRFEEARRDLDSAMRLAQDAGRTLDSLALRLDLAELQLAAGARPSALAAAEDVLRESAPRGLGALAQRARHLARAPLRPARSVGPSA